MTKDKLLLLWGTVYIGFVIYHASTFWDEGDYGYHSKCSINLNNPETNFTQWKTIMLNSTACAKILESCPQIRDLCHRPDTLSQKLLSGNNFKALLLHSPTGFITPYHSAATDTIACLISGRKKWYFKNKQVLQYYGHENLHMGIMYSWKHFQSEEVIQNPGDCLYFKPWTWHKVITESESIMLTTHHSNNMMNSLWQLVQLEFLHH
eukprot:TRINITY_DN2193_c0_g1_i1.p1 TRINITY_DN2193_c0_g1~~TRINITY_DN2193_c0_g1_i1.p1  ORF type:complete len:215 (-),score=14.66 TRINITY_DN2193_c0_g1_i1:49-669(-)